MPVYAMGLKFAEKTSAHVLLVFNRLEVVRVDANWTTAQMVKTQPLRDVSNHIFVGDPVGKTRFTGAVSNSSVSVGVNSTYPLPAVTESRRKFRDAAFPIHLGPEKFFPRKCSRGPVVVPPNRVVLSAHPAPHRFGGTTFDRTCTLAHINTSSVLVGAGRLDTAPVHLILTEAA